jgi:hypothetical protein
VKATESEICTESWRLARRFYARLAHRDPGGAASILGVIDLIRERGFLADLCASTSHELLNIVPRVQRSWSDGTCLRLGSIEGMVHVEFKEGRMRPFRDLGRFDVASISGIVECHLERLLLENRSPKRPRR